MTITPAILLRRRERGLTVLELACVFCLISILSLATFYATGWMRDQGAIGASTAQLHHLVVANTSYAADHNGEFCPAMSRDNRTRWHGGRQSINDEFDPEKGYLAAYLGGGRRIITCPLLKDYKIESFEKGSGGYGYNATYIGGTPATPYRGAVMQWLPALGRVVMFATTALAVEGRIQEYPFCDPWEWVDPRGNLRGQLQPSTHFRAHGKALIAWGDGTVTAEAPNTAITGPNFYGGNNTEFNIGWFGPPEKNGYWNPSSPACQGRPAGTGP